MTAVAAHGGAPKTRLEAARVAAGYGGPQGLARFARRVRRCPRYVRRIELRGNAPEVYALEAQRLLRCHLQLFMWPNWEPEAVRGSADGPEGAGQSDSQEADW